MGQTWEGILGYNEEFSFDSQCSRQSLKDTSTNGNLIWFTFLKDHTG